MRVLHSITDSIDKNLKKKKKKKIREIVKNREAWHAAVHRVSKSQI